MKNIVKTARLQKCYRDYKRIKKQQRVIGDELGWYDDAGTLAPLERLANGDATEEEREAALEKETIHGELEFIRLQLKRNKIAEEIVALEDELGIPPEESPAGK